MLPPETTATIRRWPREASAGETAAATAQAPAPSAMTRARSAVSRIACAASSSETTIDSSTWSRSSGHIESSTDLPPAPSTNDGVHSSKRLAWPRSIDRLSGAAVSGSAA